MVEYGSDKRYTGHNVNDLEKINLKFIKATLGARKQAHTPAISDETGLCVNS